MMVRTTRRTLLKGAAATATITTPFLRLLERPARAAGATKRLIIFATQNGFSKGLYPLWWPAPPTDGTSISNLEAKFGPRILKPLDALMPKATVMRGLDMKSAYKAPIPANHGPDFANALTGVQAPAEGKIGGISVDQYIAKAIGSRTKFASLQLGVEASGTPLLATGPNAPLPYENSPRKLFDRVFAGLVPGTGAAATDPLAMQKLRADRLSMLDAVKQDLADVRCQLGVPERPKFDAHVQSIRELEKNLSFDTATTPTSKSCEAPVAPVDGDFPTKAKQQLDLLTMILACDLTRVAAIRFGHYQTVFSWLGITQPDHSLAHYLGVGMTADEQSVALVKIETWYAQQFAYLCNKMNAIADGTGTLLDSTANLWLHEQSDGATHNRRDMPYVLMGSCGGVFKTGRVLNFNGTGHAGLLISLANAMDVPTTTFGDPDFSNGPLAGL